VSLRCGSIARRTSDTKILRKGPGIPVSHETSKLRVAVAGEQLDTVCCHGAECKCGGMVSSGSQYLPPNFFATSGHGPCGERWHRAPTQQRSQAGVLYSFAQQGLHFTFSVAHAQDRKKSMQVIDKRSMPSGTFSEMDSRQQWLHVDIPIITEVEISSAQAAGVCTKLSVREPH
jgi:hypothetical protein